MPVDPRIQAALDAPLRAQSQHFAPARATAAAKGYFTRPGSGPEGETCRSCANVVAHHYSRTFYKCALVTPTHGAATDIRLRWPACSGWRARDEARG